MLNVSQSKVSKALSEREINMPEDISVIGINDIPVAKYYSPPLTTISSRINDEYDFIVKDIFDRIYKNGCGKSTVEWC